MDKWIDVTIKDKLDAKQYGAVTGISTTDALIEILHQWYKPTDNVGTFVRPVLLDYSKTFDLVDQNLLLSKLEAIGIPTFIVRWLNAFSLIRSQRVKIDGVYSGYGHPTGGIPQGTATVPKHFLVHINDLQTPYPLYKYVDDGALFEICSTTSVSLLRESVDIVSKWTKEDNMIINASKTNKHTKNGHMLLQRRTSH